MKKVKVALLTMVLLVSAMTMTTFAEEAGPKHYKGFEYEIYEDLEDPNGESYIMIYDYVGSETELTIPATIEDIPVKGVYTTSPNSTVTTVRFEEGIQEAGHASFMDYTALKTVYLPSTFKHFGQGAFELAENLENIFVAEGNERVVDIDGVTYTGIYHYQMDSEGNPLWDEEMIFGGYMLSVYPKGKSDTNYVIQETIGDAKVVEIQERAFYGAKNLTSIVIPSSVNVIYDSAFAECVNLQKAIFYNMEWMYEWNGEKDEEAIFGYSDYDLETDTYTIPSWADNLEIYCYTGSEIEAYAKKYNLKYTNLDNTAISNTGNVTVTAKDENALEAGTALVVSGVQDDALSIAVKNSMGQNKFTVLDITLQKNGVTVQPKGKVTVSIDVPEGFDGTKCKVYHIAANGSYTDMKATYADGKLSFETDHFSQYAVVEGSMILKSPQTGDLSQTMIWLALMLVSCMLIGMTYKGRKNI